MRILPDPVPEDLVGDASPQQVGKDHPFVRDLPMSYQLVQLLFNGFVSIQVGLYNEYILYRPYNNVQGRFYSPGEGAMRGNQEFPGNDNFSHVCNDQINSL